MNPLRILKALIGALCGDTQHRTQHHTQHRHPSRDLTRHQVNARFLAAMTEIFGPIDSAENRIAEQLLRTRNEDA
jgi:hypothetical protein